MQISILNGIYTDQNSDYRVSYPINLVPVAQPQGISAGYLRPAEGITKIADTQGLDRGGINWNGECYRVTGTKLIKISSTNVVTVLGDVGGAGLVTMDYSFDYLAIASGGNLFYWDGTTLTQVGDPDIGNVLDFVWVDGYFMTTDGEFLIVTDLSDPFAVNPLKYGSSEVDPDNVVSVKKLRNEVHAINRYTIEVFDNAGGNGFPFQRIDGAQITKGCVGTHANCVFSEAIAFVGGSRNEPPAVWLGAGGNTSKISTREVDLILQNYTDNDISKILLESRIDTGKSTLYLHLPDKCLCYDLASSQALGSPIWYILSSSINGEGQYNAINSVWCYGKWIAGHPTQSKAGYLDDLNGAHWGQKIGWEFGTSIVYNEGRGAIFHDMELVALTGRAALNIDDVLSTQFSNDGETWSQPKTIKAGKQGNRNRRLVWFRQGKMQNIRIQRFNGTSNSRLSFARLEARIEGLNF
jgi:hypothetical protein